MIFEARELKPYAEPIRPDEIKEGSNYFLVNFLDAEMHLPQMETLVFIGKNIEEEDQDCFYFQDASSYKEGNRHNSAYGENCATLFKCKSYELNGIYDFERALEILMWCSLRRRGLTK